MVEIESYQPPRSYDSAVNDDLSIGPYVINGPVVSW